MRGTWMAFVLFVVPAAFAEGPNDAQIGQALLREIHALREELQGTAALIQRVQIAMYRLGVQSGIKDRASQALDQVRAECKGVEFQKQMHARQVEQAENRKRDARDPAERAAAEQLLEQIEVNRAWMLTQDSRCPEAETQAESQLRLEQAKFQDLEQVLDRPDRALADRPAK